jgi:hypothetical protein
MDVLMLLIQKSNLFLSHWSGLAQQQQQQKTMNDICLDKFKRGSTKKKILETKVV